MDILQDNLRQILHFFVGCAKDTLQITNLLVGAIPYGKQENPPESQSTYGVAIKLANQIEWRRACMSKIGDGNTCANHGWMERSSRYGNKRTGYDCKNRILRPKMSVADEI